LSLRNGFRACRYAKGWFRRAEALHGLDRLPEAIAAAERAASLDSRTDGAAQLLAMLSDSHAGTALLVKPNLEVRCS
jgi:hypothetical protein